MNVAPSSQRKTNATLEETYNESEILSRHRQREDSSQGSVSLRKFVDVRREMLMLNLSISTQQESIEKLHSDLETKERSLSEKERLLTQEITRFDTFLKEQYQEKVALANKLDERLTTRAEMESVLADLTQQINIVEAGIRQQKDLLVEYENMD